MKCGTIEFACVFVHFSPVPSKRCILFKFQMRHLPPKNPLTIVKKYSSPSISDKLSWKMRQTFEKNVQKSNFKLVPCSILMIPYLFYNLLNYFAIFPSLQVLCFTKLLGGTILVYLEYPSPLLPMYRVTQFKFYNATIFLFNAILTHLLYQLGIG